MKLATHTLVRHCAPVAPEYSSRTPTRTCRSGLGRMVARMRVTPCLRVLSGSSRYQSASRSRETKVPVPATRDTAVCDAPAAGVSAPAGAGTKGKEAIDTSTMANDAMRRTTYLLHGWTAQRSPATGTKEAGNY